MSNTQKNKTINFNLVKRILSYTKPYKKIFIGAAVITLLLSALAIVRPLLISYTLNEFVKKEKSVKGLNIMCLLILFFLLTEALLQIVNMRITNLLGQNIVKDLRNQVYKHIIGLKNTYFDNTPVGMLVTRAISDIESLSDVFAQGFAFDSVQGDVNIVHGMANTRNLKIKGINALVHLNGSADLARETQKLRVQILPIVDTGTTSLLAGLTVNPAVGLTAFFAQWLLQNPLSRASSQEFLVDGSWANPQVTRVDQRPAPAQLTTPLTPP